jgi:hypothetical protein
VRQFNTYGFITLYGIFFLVILYKVLNVPVTTDEVPAVFFYSKFSFWEIMMFPDNWPNNHILNTLLTKCSISVFGKEQWAVRLPNLLSFIFFGFAVFRILKLVLKLESTWFLVGAILFVNPYLLDFFGLARGYGISGTMVTFSILLLLEGYEKRRKSWIWLSLLTSILASYANFTALVFWAAVVILVWFYFFIDNEGQFKKWLKPTLIIFIISLAYLALIITPIMKMQGTDQFKYWSSGGFYDDTIRSLIYEWQYKSKFLTGIRTHFVSGFAGIIIMMNFFLLWKHFKKEKYSLKGFFTPAFVALAILLLPAIINIFQTIILGTPNLKGRTALFFYPLFSTVLVVAMSALPKIKKPWVNNILLVFILAVFGANLSHRTKLTSVKEWEYDQNTLDVINYLREKHNENLVSLKTNWIFHSSFYFYYDAGKVPWLDLQPYDYNLDVNTPSEYYYIFADDFKFLEPRFEVVYKFSPNRWLLQQKKY